MLTLGLAGGLDPVHEDLMDTPDNYTYDGAAVLIEDGRVIAASEEERLNRIKHSNKFPTQSVRFCLKQRGVAIQDIDLIAYYVEQNAANALLSRLYLARPDIKPRIDARTLLAVTLGRELGCEIDPARIRFYQHKLTHAVSAMALSGFDKSLVFIIDNAGGVFLGRRENEAVSLESVLAIPPSKSLGRFCQAVFPFLGLSLFDESRAMELAPHGDAKVYEPLFRSFYELLPNGDFALHLDRIYILMGKVDPRPKQKEFSQAHKDIAASLQQAQEEIVLHVLRHYRQATGQRNLCMAGGMVENSSTNGKVLHSGLFDRVFVHAAAHDAGCALGAALLASYEEGRAHESVHQIQHVYWGTDIGDDSSISGHLHCWNSFISFEKRSDIARHTARLMGQGAVVGWMQGRSEFGPRALGNRSILADPRPQENKDRINQMVKKREGYRPFAPSVLEEDARLYFEFPDGIDRFPFMIFVLKVREEMRRQLGAITHIDGTARVHTVSRETNPRYWDLIKAFKDITGVGVLLNTSFNNNVEPIVDSVEDGIVSFLTTGLDYLVVGDYVVKKRTPRWEDQLSMKVSLPPYVQICQTRGFVERKRMTASHEIHTSYNSKFPRRVSGELGAPLMGLNREETVGELLRQSGVEGEREQDLMAELNDLWSERLVIMHPDRSDWRSLEGCN
jgi:carbamoyltransferase